MTPSPVENGALKRLVDRVDEGESYIRSQHAMAAEHVDVAVAVQSEKLRKSTVSRLRQARANKSKNN